ncbi:MAG TPA: serine/threonine-protein kinase [Polyangiaceae bacterium]|nr:serine/threonine-protein kinase [Polyangiaceae bacterium]
MNEALPVRTLRGGRYAIVGELGAGSQAETLDAVDKQAGRAVAIKRFQVRGCRSWKDVELAEREARVLSTLSHPNLPVYIEHFEEDGALYLVMEKIEGETLASLRKRRAQLSQDDIARFLADAENALGYLHSRVPPIIHRDIKPGNVIRRADGSFVFVDFGSVRDQLKPEGGSTVVGTFGYMAPEQFQGRALPGSDVYAVAATALALVTGSEPEDLPHRGLAIDVPAALGKSAEPWLVRALSAMLEPDPDKRPSRVNARRPATRTDSMHERQRAAARQREAERERTRGESRRERDERRRRAERESRAADHDGSEWHRPEPWNFYELHEQQREQAQRIKTETRRIKREIKQQVREQTRRIKREAREYQRARYGDWQRPRPQHHGFGPAAPLLIALVVLALTAARVATWALFRVFLPIFLGFLSVVFFSRGLRRAAWRVREVGAAGDRGLLHAIDVVRGRMLGRDDEIETEGEPLDEDARAPSSATTREAAPTAETEAGARVRVQSARVRVEPDANAAERDELTEDEADDARRQQR